MPERKRITLTQEIRDQKTPEQVLALLEEGNRRFTNSSRYDRDYLYDVVTTAELGQHPYAISLSCIDSRVPVEHVLDVGIGDVFSARVAGNIVTPAIVGSIEYACAVGGVKLVLVMGHTCCGAIKGAIDNVQLGNLTGLLDKIHPAIKALDDFPGEHTSANKAFVNAVAAENVRISIREIRETSPVLKRLEAAGKIMFVGAMYHIETGKLEIISRDVS